MRILALTRYQRLGSSSRVRFYQYFPYLKAHGVEIFNAPFFNDKYVRDLYNGRRASTKEVLQAYLKRLTTLLRNESFDLLWVEKEFLPWFPAKIETVFKAHKIPYAVDYDDAVFHRYDLHPNPLIRTFLGHKIDHVMQSSNMVIAGNEYIAERARNAGSPQIEILPSVVDVGQYTLKQPDIDKVFKIGWIGSPVTSKYLHLVRDAVTKLNRESDARLILVGVENKHLFPDVPTEFLPWSEELEHTVNQKFDVGIMPLADGPFERGKCGYKLIQYMAGGIPVIASPVGVNQQIVEREVNGYLANTPDEWLDAFRSLRDNPQKRDSMGKAGRKKVETFYNLQITVPKLLNLLKSAVAS